MLTTGSIPEGELPRWGKMVAPGIYGPNHQHFFNFRLDMNIDGPGNSVFEVDSVPAIRSFVASGLGWSIMPRPPAWDRTVGAQLVVEPEIRRLLHLAHAKRRPMSRAFEAVLDAVMELVEAERRHPDGQWQPLEAPQRPA